MAYEDPRAIATFLGLGWSEHASRDKEYTVNTTLGRAGVFQFRDLTLDSGVVLTVASGGPTIIVCRDLIFGNTASQVSANGRGAASGSVGVGALSHIYGATNPSVTSDGYAQVIALLSLGGGGVTGSGTVGSDGGAATSGRFSAICLPWAMQVGLTGGGGGGKGGTGSGTYTGPTASASGGATGTGSGGSADGSGGGSGIGGGGSGGAAGATSGSPGAGQPGGGIVLVICRRVLGAAGIVSANGTAGSAGGATNGAGGGGGGGGYAGIVALDGGVTPTVTSNGGAQGAGAGTGGNGGNGGAGIAEKIGWD